MLDQESGNLAVCSVARRAKLAISLGVFVLVLAQGAFGRSRIRKIDSTDTFELSGNLRPSLPLNDLGPEPPEALHSISVTLQMSPEQKNEVTQLLSSQRQPGSRDYHNWLSPSDFGNRFGSDSADISKIISWFEDLGFSDLQVNAGKTRISMRGTTAVIESAFHTSLHRFSGNQVHFSNISNPVLPTALRGVVSGVLGLHDFRPKARVSVSGTVRLNPRYSLPNSSNHALTPGDFAVIYDLKALHDQGLTGTGQTIAIAGQSDISINAVRAFRKAADLPFNDPTIQIVDEDPGTNSDGELEGELDVEWAGAVAPGATLNYINSTDAFASATYAVDNKLGSILVLTYGSCESSFTSAEIAAMEATLAQANAQGMTVVVPSGDAGPADCQTSGSASRTLTLAVDYPASSQFVTGVGGTTLSDANAYWNSSNDSTGSSAISYVPETAWNDSLGIPAGGASGGGTSSLFSKPAWQVGLNVPADAYRHVPDLAFAASPNVAPYLVCSGLTDCSNGFADSQGHLHELGGTSFAAPVLAGVVAILDQQYGSQGNINARLYTLASFSPDIYHDITEGSNLVPCSTVTLACVNGYLGYTAGIGYDQVTGLGSVDAGALSEEWQSDFQLSGPPQAITLATGESTTASVQIVGTGGYRGVVTLQCKVSSAISDVSCSSTGSVTGSGSLPVTLSRAKSGLLMGYPMGVALSPFLLSAVAISLVWCLSKQTRKRVAFTVVSALLMVSCGGGGSTPSNSGVPIVSVSGTVTVIAVSGTLSHSTSVVVSE